MESTHPAHVIFQLKNRRPQRWQDRHDVHVEKQSVSVNVEAKLTEGQQAELLQLLAERQGPRILAPPRTADNLRLPETETPLR